MGELEKELVPYQEAFELKELGFDEPCFAYWDGNKSFIIDRNSKIIQKNSNYKNIFDGIISAPTFSQAFRWFREKYDLCYEITHAGIKGEYHAFVRNSYIYGNNRNEPSIFTYEEAELVCLKKLIEIVKTMNNEQVN